MTDRELLEPVGWFESPYGAFRANPLHKISVPSPLLNWQIPLYITPPRRGPLPIDEILDMMPQEIPAKFDGALVFFARAIEAANGIGAAQKGKP